jgi:tetratricopeptide (TPR) repeat protein
VQSGLHREGPLSFPAGSNRGLHPDLNATSGLEIDAESVRELVSRNASSGEWEKAPTEFRRAIVLEPNDFDLHLNLGRISTIRGNISEALREFDKARRIERVYALVRAWTSYAYFLKGEADSALKESVRAVRLDSALSATMNLGVLVRLGTRHPETTTPRPWSADVQRASVLLAIGDSAGALAALEQSARATGSLWVWLISPRDPAYDPVRQSKRFADLVRRAGLDVAWATVRR